MYMTMSASRPTRTPQGPFLVTARGGGGPRCELPAEGRIAQLRAEIAAGRYRVSSAELADCLLKQRTLLPDDWQ